MKEIEENEGQVQCPACEKTLINFSKEIYHVCSHVVLTYSDFAGGFSYIDESMTEVVDEMRRKLEENEARIDEDDYKILCMEDLITDFAEKSHGKYKLVTAYSEGIACGPVSNTDYILIKLSSRPKSRKPKIKK